VTVYSVPIAYAVDLHVPVADDEEVVLVLRAERPLLAAELDVLLVEGALVLFRKVVEQLLPGEDGLIIEK